MFFNLAYLFVLICLSPWLVVRGWKTGRYRTGIRERLFGILSLHSPDLNARPESIDEHRVWFHAVSVGEVQILSGLIAAFQECNPNTQILVTSSTDSGLALAKKLFPKLDVSFLPLDFTWSMKRAIRSFKPDLIVLVELELWPNMIRIAKEHGCRVAVVNGRLSQSSFRGYQKVRWMLSATFRRLDWIGVQEPVYAERFEQLGCPKSSISITGSIKFDNAITDREHPEIQSRREQLRLSSNHLVWVVGSTQAPEESMAVDVWKAIRLEFPQLKLIIVPRHPDRFEEVAKLFEVEAEPGRWWRRSQMPSVLDDRWQIMLGDTIGELKWWWGLADIALVGGSFGSRGGQNMIEPAAFGSSVSFGPNTKNFADVTRMLLDQDAAERLETPQAVLAWVRKNLADPTHRATIGKRAQNVVLANQGATQRTLHGLRELLS